MLIQVVVDEKKKKQDDKLRKAQQLREAQEKEKAEKQRKLLQVNSIQRELCIWNQIAYIFM